MDNIVVSMKSVPKRIQELQIQHFYKADPAYGSGVAKGLGQIAIEFAGNGELSYHVESIDRIAKGKGFETWRHLLEFSGQEYSGLKETLAVDMRGKEAPLPAK